MISSSAHGGLDVGFLEGLGECCATLHKEQSVKSHKYLHPWADHGAMGGPTRNCPPGVMAAAYAHHRRNWPDQDLSQTGGGADADYEDADDGDGDAGDEAAACCCCC